MSIDPMTKNQQAMRADPSEGWPLAAAQAQAGGYPRNRVPLEGEVRPVRFSAASGSGKKNRGSTTGGEPGTGPTGPTGSRGAGKGGGKPALETKNRLDMSKPDLALLSLYDHLAAGQAPKAGSIAAMDAAGRREYNRLSRRRTRARVKASVAAGRIEPTTANVREALADAALMILAVGAPGVDQVRTVLGTVFAKRPGAPVSIEAKARTGKLRPRLIGETR